MTKSKNTKRALWASVLSMLVCAAMLVGSTFAWFTDSVTSGKNKIVAGNLDIKLSYKNAAAADGADFAEVTAATEDLFVSKDGGAILWEPGAAAVTYLKLENKGSLALKYRFSVNATDVVTGDDGAALSEVLKTAVVPIEEAQVGAYTREMAIEAAKAEDAASVLTYVGEGTMTADADPAYLAMIVYFPEEIGNTHNGKVYNRTDGVELETDLALSLVATQTPHENDSFGNDYDANIVFPIVATAPVVDGKDAVLKNNEKTVIVTVPYAAIEEGAETLTLNVDRKETTAALPFENNPSNLITYDISVTGIAPENTENISVSIYAGKNLSQDSIRVLYNSGTDTEEMTVTGYDAETGLVTFTTTHFSEYIIVKDTNALASKGLKFEPVASGSENYQVLGGTCTDSVVYIPSSYNGHKVTRIANAGFQNRKDITKVIIADGIECIDRVAFYGCENLTEVVIPDSVQYMMCSSFTSVPGEVVDGVRYIGAWAVQAQTNVSEITLRDGTIGIAMDFLESNVKTLTIADSVKYICNGAFRYARGLETLTIGAGVEIIGVLPEDIGNQYMFENCNKLKTINFNAVNCKDGKITNSLSISNKNTNSVTLNIGAEVQRIPAYMCYASNGNLGIHEIKFAEGSVCKEIGRYAFWSNGTIESLILPEGLTTIGDSAFDWCKLTSISFPSTLTTVGARAFVNRNPNMTLHMSEDNQVYSCNDNIIYNKNKTELVYVATQGKTDVTIPDTVTTIRQNAFMQCTVKNVFIPESVKSIEAHAFDSSSLQNIYYAGTQEEWDKISVDSTGNNKLSSAAMHYSSESIPTN